MPERDHAIVIPLPDGDRGRVRAERETPAGHERQVVLEPAGDAGAHRGVQRGGHVVGVLTGEHGLVRVADQAPEALDDVGAGDGAENGRVLLQEGGQLRRAGFGRAELRDVLRSHPGQPVQAGAPPAGPPRRPRRPRGTGPAAARRRRARAGRRRTSRWSGTFPRRARPGSPRRRRPRPRPGGRAGAWTGRNRAGRAGWSGTRGPAPSRSSAGRSPGRRRACRGAVTRGIPSSGPSARTSIRRPSASAIVACFGVSVAWGGPPGRLTRFRAGNGGGFRAANEGGSRGPGG